MKITIDEREYDIHFRHTQDDQNNDTICFLTDARTGFYISSGIANCSRRDRFNRAIGRKLSLGRAIQIGFPREKRAAVWAAIWAARKEQTKKPWFV